MVTKLAKADSAVFSADGRYRYSLHRVFDSGKGLCVFVMLNPSTADRQVNDPTIRRCIGFARDWGYAELEVVNLFAWKATKSRELRVCAEPVGVENDSYIRKAARDASLLMLAWGNLGGMYGRSEWAKQVLEEYSPHHLGLTKLGEPRHPLYVPKSQMPVSFS